MSALFTSKKLLARQTAIKKHPLRLDRKVTVRGAEGRIRTDDDHLLTLTTCDRTYGGTNGRFVVMAVRED